MYSYENNSIPYYQPIITIENNCIYGYEVMRKNNFGSVQSLNVDEKLIKKSLQYFKDNCRNDELLFFKIKLDSINQYCKNPAEMPLLVQANKIGVDYRKIVVEIDEFDFDTTIKTSIMALSYCRSVGIKLALDSFGKNGIDVLRLSQISPDMIKIDERLVHGSENNNVFRDFLVNQTEFASKLGIEVVYKGIESETQLKNCVNSSGRYYQGNFLKKPDVKIGDFEKSDILEECFIKSIMRFNSKNSKKNRLKNQLDEVVKALAAMKAFTKNRDDTDARIMGAADIIPNYVRRVYLCNKYGFQITSNIEFRAGTITLIDNFNKNWAWRGFYKEALFNINKNSKSYITHSYNDITTKEKIYTYVLKLNSVSYFLADISLNCI